MSRVKKLIITITRSCLRWQSFFFFQKIWTACIYIINSYNKKDKNFGSVNVRFFKLIHFQPLAMVTLQCHKFVFRCINLLNFALFRARPWFTCSIKSIGSAISVPPKLQTSIPFRSLSSRFEASMMNGWICLDFQEQNRAENNTAYF